MKIIKKLLKYLIVFLIVIIVACVGVYFAFNKPIPAGKTGPEAEALAKKMLKAINYTNYQKTRFIEWSFNNKHHYKWDKVNNLVTVKWENKLVKLHLKNYAKSEVYIDEVKMHTDPKQKLIDTAVKLFNNDSFWLVAPFKIMEENVERKLVTLENGEEALLVTYTEGGTTPGDSYLWLLNDNGFPYAFKMWVEIIPIGGLEATWDDWMVTESTTYLPTSHKFLFFDIDMGNIRAYNVQ